MVNGKKPFIRALRLRPRPLSQFSLGLFWSSIVWLCRSGLFSWTVHLRGETRQFIALCWTHCFFQLSPNVIYTPGATKRKCFFFEWRSCLTLGVGVSPGATYSFFICSHHDSIQETLLVSTCCSMLGKMLRGKLKVFFFLLLLIFLEILPPIWRSLSKCLHI